MLNFVADMSESSARTIANYVDNLQAYVLRTLNENRFHPFYFQRVQTSDHEDYPLYLNFFQWFLQQCYCQIL